MASVRAMAVSMLMLRIVAFMLLAGSMALIIMDKFKELILQRNKFTVAIEVETTFKDIITYRYMLATAAGGMAYGLLQLPFVVYYAWTDKRMIRNWFLPEFDFYRNKIMSYFLATGVGAGFAVSFELKKFVDNFFNVFGGFLLLNEDNKRNTDKFFDRGSIATGLLAGGFLFMAVLSVLSSINRTPTSRGFLK